MSVKKDGNGICDELRYFTMNDSFISPTLVSFFKDESDNSKNQRRTTERSRNQGLEGELYTANVQKELKFEDACFRAAWKREPIHATIDDKNVRILDRKLFLPVAVNFDKVESDVAFCLFIYTLKQGNDVNSFPRYLPISPHSSLNRAWNFKVKNRFLFQHAAVTDYIREYAGAYGASIMSYQSDLEEYSNSGSTVVMQ